MKLEIDPEINWITLRFGDTSGGATVIEALLEGRYHIELLEEPNEKVSVAAVIVHEVGDFSHLPAVLTALKQNGLRVPFDPHQWDALRIICLDFAVLKLNQGKTT